MSLGVSDPHKIKIVNDLCNYYKLLEVSRKWYSYVNRVLFEDEVHMSSQDSLIFHTNYPITECLQVFISGKKPTLCPEATVCSVQASLNVTLNPLRWCQHL